MRTGTDLAVLVVGSEYYDSDAALEAEIARSMDDVADWSGLQYIDEQQQQQQQPGQPEAVMERVTEQRVTDGEAGYARVDADPGFATTSNGNGSMGRGESDDEEYDRLFLEMIDSSSLVGQAQAQQQVVHGPGTLGGMADEEMMMDTSGA